MINWKMFWLLFSACVYGVICVIPYSFSMQSGSLESLSISLYELLALQLLQNVALFAFFVFAGLHLADKAGFGAPLLEAWSRGGEARPGLKAILSISTLLGALSAALITALDFSFYLALPNEPIYTGKLPAPPTWQEFLASFYSAINEEIVSRLFLMSLFTWILLKIIKKSERLAIWLANAFAAIFSGLLHLPSTAILIPITPYIIARAIILNGIAGTIFGWLYWKKGLESAMISHFTTDIIIHVILS